MQNAAAIPVTSHAMRLVMRAYSIAEVAALRFAAVARVRRLVDVQEINVICDEDHPSIDHCRLHAARMAAGRRPRVPLRVIRWRDDPPSALHLHVALRSMVHPQEWIRSPQRRQ